MTDFAKARKHMVDSQIAPSGVSDAAILDAFLATPREIFVPQALQGICHSDGDVELAQGRYLLSPMVHAKLLQGAQPKSSDVVLDVGCTTGYSSAILSPLVTTIFATDSNQNLLAIAQKCWKDLVAYNIVSSCGAPDAGFDDETTYDLIIINGAVAQLPQGLLSKLSAQGRLLTILKETPSTVGRAVIARKNSDGSFSVKTLFDANAPYLPEFAPKKSFVF